MLQQVYSEIAKAAHGCGRDFRDIKLVAVSKGQSVDAIRALYDQGVRDFGESRVQEVEEKRKFLPQDIAWHLIGSLQTKKVPKVVGAFALIHSVDSLELAEKLSSVSLQRGLITDILIQVNASGELTKHGFSLEACQEVFPRLVVLQGVRMHGLMTMAPLTGEQNAIRACFLATATLRKTLAERYKLPQFTELSMGMSNDFCIAIECGATIVRIGSRLFYKS